MMVTVVYTHFILLLRVTGCPPLWALLNRVSIMSLAAATLSAMNVPEAGAERFPVQGVTNIASR